MKRITLILLAAAAIIAGSVSCSKVNDIDKRLTQLEQTVSDLKAQVLAGAVITSVEKTEDGCTFTLSNGQSYTVTNGKNGTDGEAIIADVKIEEDFVVLTLKNGEILRISYQNPLSMVALSIVPDYDDGTVKEPKTTETMGTKSHNFYLDVAVTPAKYAEILADTERFIHKAVFSPVKTKSDFGNAFTVSPTSVTYMGGAPVPFLQAYFDLDDETAATLENTAYTVSYSIEDKDGVHGAATAFVAISNDKGSGGNVPGDDINNYVLPGEFSVSATKKVYFSRGNLYYEGNTKKWMFEKEQYDFRTYEGKTCNISDGTGTQTITPQGNWGLFGWVGYSTQIFRHEPEMYGVSTSMNLSDYGSKSGENLYFGWEGAAGKATSINWSSLTMGEWEYIFYDRRDAAGKCGYATVGNVHGIIILPDSFTDPNTNKGNEAFEPNSIGNWDVNVYSTGECWEAMEAAGAVFLPAAGRRFGSHVSEVGESGNYWTNSSYFYPKEFSANLIMFDIYYPQVVVFERYYGLSVRLVIDTEYYF